MRPDVGVSSPEMQPIVVDLPAPFGPSSPKTSPAFAVRLTSLTATRSPYRLPSWETVIMEDRGRLFWHGGCGDCVTLTA